MHEISAPMWNQQNVLCNTIVTHIIIEEKEAVENVRLISGMSKLATVFSEDNSLKLPVKDSCIKHTTKSGTIVAAQKKDLEQVTIMI